MVTVRHGLFEASSLMIDEILHVNGRRPTKIQISNLLVTAGALLRQLKKRFGSDDLSNLNDRIVDQAYLNEVARVIRGWPSTGEWIRPLAFHGTAYLIRMHLAVRKLTEFPEVLTPGRFPSLLDMNLPIVIRQDDKRLVYANRLWRAKTCYVPAEVVKSATFPIGAFYAESELDRLQQEFESMRNGERLLNRVYETAVPGIGQLVVYASSAIFDDDGEFIGIMKCQDDYARCDREVMRKVQEHELSFQLELGR